jgi:hypothetical protein
LPKQTQPEKRNDFNATAGYLGSGLQLDHGNTSATCALAGLEGDARAGFGRTKPIWCVPDFGTESNPERLRGLGRDSGDVG